MSQKTGLLDSFGFLDDIRRMDARQVINISKHLSEGLPKTCNSPQQ